MPKISNSVTASVIGLTVLLQYTATLETNILWDVIIA